MRPAPVDFKVLLTCFLIVGLLIGCNRTIATEYSTSQNLFRQRLLERQARRQERLQQLRPDESPRENTLALGPNFVSLNLTHQGRRRDYLLYTPPSYNKSRPSPVVIGFHGGTSTNARFAQTTNFHQLADAKGFLVIYPNAINKNWNDGRGTVNRDIDDVGFVTAIIEEITQLRNIDARRVYATGISNGAFLVQRLACERADRIAAFSSVAGAMPALLESKCNPKNYISMVMFNSPDDRFVPWKGGETRGAGGTVVSPEGTASFWGLRNRCSDFTDKALVGNARGDNTKIVTRRYNECSLNSAVLMYIINGGGHTWPGGEAQPAWLLGQTSEQINATRLSWDFFQKHSLPR